MHAPEGISWSNDGARNRAFRQLCRRNRLGEFALEDSVLFHCERESHTDSPPILLLSSRCKYLVLGKLLAVFNYSQNIQSGSLPPTYQVSSCNRPSSYLIYPDVGKQLPNMK